MGVITSKAIDPEIMKAIQEAVGESVVNIPLNYAVSYLTFFIYEYSL